MRQSGRHHPAVVALCLTASLLSGCAGYGGAKRTVRTTLPGREIVVVVRGEPTVATAEAGDAAVITFAGRDVRVESDRLLVDGVVRAELPAEARRVEVVWFGNLVSVTADGKEVFKGEW